MNNLHMNFYPSSLRKQDLLENSSKRPNLKRSRSARITRKPCAIKECNGGRSNSVDSPRYSNELRFDFMSVPKHRLVYPRLLIAHCQYGCCYCVCRLFSRCSGRRSLFCLNENYDSSTYENDIWLPSNVWDETELSLYLLVFLMCFNFAVWCLF